MEKFKCSFTLAFCLMLGCLLPGMSQAEELELRVIVQKANIRLRADAQSVIILQVSIGTVLKSDGKEGNWYRVILPPDENGIKRGGYIHSNLTEVITKEIEPQKKTPREPEKEAPKIAEKVGHVLEKPDEPDIKPEIAAPRKVTAASRPSNILRKFNLKLSGGLGFLLNGTGDFEKLRTGTEEIIAAWGGQPDFESDFNWKKLRGAIDLEIGLSLNIAPEINIGISSGYIKASSQNNQYSFGFEFTETGASPIRGIQNLEVFRTANDPTATRTLEADWDFARDFTVGAVPLNLNLNYNLPSCSSPGMTITPYARLGVGLYFGRMTYTFSELYTHSEIFTSEYYSDFQEDVERETNIGGRANDIAIGVNSGVGASFRVSPNIFLGAEIYGRYVNFRNWKGDWTEDWSWNEKLYDENHGWYSDVGDSDASKGSGDLKFLDLQNPILEREEPDIRMAIPTLTLNHGFPVISEDFAKINLNDFGLRLTVDLCLDKKEKDPWAELYDPDIWTGGEPEFENLYDDAKSDFDLGRESLWDAVDLVSDDDPLGFDLARDAQDYFDQAKEKIEQGLENGDIGEWTAEDMLEDIKRYEEDLKKILDSPIEVPLDDPAVVVEPIDLAPPPSWPGLYYYATNGGLQPTQGVWQDDEYFEDKPTKQLTCISQESRIDWRAELNMVVNRPTVVTGIRDGGASTNRNAIRIEGITNGTTRVPVRFRFKLIDSSGERIIYTEPGSQNQIPIDGPVGPEQDFAASILAGEGLPPDYPFKIEQPGEYTIEAELIREDGSETGIKVTVSGLAQHTYGPNVRLIPVIINREWTKEWALQFQTRTRELARRAQEHIPDFFPLIRDELSVTEEPVRELRISKFSLTERLLDKVGWSTTPEDLDSVRLKAEFSEQFGARTVMTGVNRVAILLSDEDFDQVRPSSDPEYRIGAFALNSKVVVLRWDNSYFTLAHELVHTLSWLWSSENMVREYKRNYHNDKDNNYGDGIRVAEFYTSLKHDRPAIMGSIETDEWITQATYHHLLSEFQKRPDPPQIVVKGFIAKNEGQYAGEFTPAYQTEGEVDLTEGQIEDGGWGLLLKNSRGRLLGAFPFPVSWWIPDIEEEVPLISFMHRIPVHKKGAVIELLGPTGLLAQKKISKNAPFINILSPYDNSTVQVFNDRFTLRWEGTDADGDTLYYNVIYSGDNGRNWRVVSYEQLENEFEVPVYWNPETIKVRVLVSDGWHSSSDEITLKVIK